MAVKSISDAVKVVIDSYPIGHEFYGNELKNDAVSLYPKSAYAYVDTFLKMARRHRRDSYICIDRNNSLYKRVESDYEREKRIIREKMEKQKESERKTANKAVQLNIPFYETTAVADLGFRGRESA